MKKHDEAFYEQLDYLMFQYRGGHISSIPELMKFIQMLYGDYVEFHPGELPEIRDERYTEYKSKSVREESSGE